jgi:hypothetical protein
VPNETKHSQVIASEIVVFFICRIASSQLADFYPPWSKLARIAALKKGGRDDPAPVKFQLRTYK